MVERDLRCPDLQRSAGFLEYFMTEECWEDLVLDNMIGTATTDLLPSRLSLCECHLDSASHTLPGSQGQLGI